MHRRSLEVTVPLKHMHDSQRYHLIDYGHDIVVFIPCKVFDYKICSSLFLQPETRILYRDTIIKNNQYSKRETFYGYRRG